MNKMLIFFFLSLYFHTPHAVIINLYDVVGKFKGEKKKKHNQEAQEVFACENEKLCCVGYLMLFEFFFVLFYLSITY